jgi:hypothetical protein
LCSVFARALVSVAAFGKAERFHGAAKIFFGLLLLAVR